MAIITDATARQLVNSVDGIDTSGLAKDTTLQAVVSALQNLQIDVNQTASNVSYNNSTSGLTSTNVQGAIDEVNNKFLWEEREFNITYSSSTNPVATANVDISKSGYTPIGVISWGVFGTSSTLCIVTSLQVNPDNSTLYYAIRVRDNGTYSHFIRVRVLYFKN